MTRTNTRYQKGYFTSDLTSTVLSSIFIIIALILTVLFSMTLLNIFKEAQTKSKLNSFSSEVINTIQNNFSKNKIEVDGIALQQLSNKNKKTDDGIINEIKKALPLALRVTITEHDLKLIEPQDFPEINYATLDMLKKTKKDNNNPVAEIHLFGRQNQYLNYVYIIDNANNKYLIISLPAQIIFNGLSNTDLEEGQVKLIQKSGNFSLVNLKTWGNKETKDLLQLNSTAIPNSYFSVESSYVPPFFLFRGITTLSAIIGLLSSLLLLVGVSLLTIKKIKQQKLKRKEQNKYVHITEIDTPQNIEETIEKHNEDTINTDKKQSNEIKIDKSIFRAYDIRGIVDEALTTDAVRLIGQAIGTENIKRGKKEIVVARDGRLSGEMLLKALVEGLIESGCSVINIGAVPTGVLYFATHHLGTGSGVMLTGSHNPPNYNGVKIMLDGETLSGKQIMDLYKSIINNELDTGEGSEQDMDIVDDYIDYISSDIQLENELKIVVDSGNGIGGEIGPQLLEEIGCEVIPLHCEIDGSFPNHHPDPSVPENLADLIAAVKASGADLGIAFDGDADRLGVVTNKGEIIYPDRILMLYAQDVLTRQPGASIIFDVKCTGHLPKEIVKNGGLPIIWKTGHSFIKAKIKETNAALAGEMSGHFFFNERWFGFDDGIYAAARLLEILDHQDRSADEIFNELPNSVSTPELKCHTKEGENYAFMEKFQKAAQFPDANITTIDGIRADFSDGWGLIRCSNTTPCLVLRFDADNEEALEKIKEEFRTQILAVDESLTLPF
jgi:phosphomannomutase/phosphoglucomutase